jgi:Zn-dependent M28 family amino/carboxypeptidase
VNGDAIYNGALDDAAGLGAIIEMARAFAALPTRPARSIVFLAVTAEEKGLQGSDYFAHHPTVPAASIVANVNVDGPFGHWKPRDLVVLGGEHSSLGRSARAAADALSLNLSPDPQPEQVFFIRSDQYSFVKQGVPSIFPNVGWLDAGGGTEANRAVQDSWTKTRYHQPSDEWDPSLDYEHMAQEVRADFLIALSIAQEPDRPRWNTGDVFEKLFGNKGVRASGPQ